MALPPMSAEKRREALDKAAEARQIRAEVKNRLRNSGGSLLEVVERGRTDDVIGKMRVVALLEAMPGIGKVRAREIMDRLGIAETRRVRGLGVQQVAGLRTLFGDR